MTSKKIIKYTWIVAGSISLMLGLIGILIPILPTTPFLLLTAYCYLRGSQRLYNWLINHAVFGDYIYNYVTYGAVSKTIKTGTFIFLWISLGISACLVTSVFVRVGLFAVGVGVSIHLISLTTLPEDRS